MATPYDCCGSGSTTSETGWQMFLALKELTTKAAELLYTDWTGPLQGISISVAATLFSLFVLYRSSSAPIFNNK